MRSNCFSGSCGSYSCLAENESQKVSKCVCVCGGGRWTFREAARELHRFKQGGKSPCLLVRPSFGIKICLNTLTWRELGRPEKVAAASSIFHMSSVGFEWGLEDVWAIANQIALHEYLDRNYLDKQIVASFTQRCMELSGTFSLKYFLFVTVNAEKESIYFHHNNFNSHQPHQLSLIAQSLVNEVGSNNEDTLYWDLKRLLQASSL